MRLSSFALPLMLIGCLGQPVGAAKAQETAHEFNLNSRFGRMEMAAEQIHPDVREKILQHRAAWGSRVHLADVEMVGLRPRDKDNQEVDVSVRIAWYRPSEGELKSTVLKQLWRNTKGDYRLVEEQRSDGDSGLLGEPTVVQAPSNAEAPPTRFPTVRLRGEVPED